MPRRFLLSALALLSATAYSATTLSFATNEDQVPEKDIFVAIYNNDADMFAKLLEEDAAGTLAKRFGKNADTPLHRAVLADSLDMAGELVRAGADVNSTNAGGFTPLHYAVTTNSADCIRFLIRSKANVNAAANGGWTPLHLAARFGFADAAKLLLAAGASKDAIANGRTPAACAREKGFDELADLLAPDNAPPVPTVPSVPTVPTVPSVPTAITAAAPAADVDAPFGSFKPDRSKFRRKVNFDRSVYEGEMSGKKPQGFGSLRFAEGHLYEGFWKRGVRCGTGIFTYANGNRYTGSWSHDVPHGEGHFAFANGGHVDGTWKYGRLWSGTGIVVVGKDAAYNCVWEDGECVSQMELPADQVPQATPAAPGK